MDLTLQTNTYTLSNSVDPDKKQAVLSGSALFAVLFLICDRNPVCNNERVLFRDGPISETQEWKG